MNAGIDDDIATAPDATTPPRSFGPKSFVPQSIRSPEAAAQRARELFRGDGREFEQSRRLLSRSVILSELSPPGASRRLLWLTSALVLGFAIWASLIELDEVAVAPGDITPLSMVQPVQHLEGGIVQRIAVMDGERVRKGDLIVALDGRSLRADLRRVRARQAALQLQAERLRAFGEGRSARFAATEFGGLRSGEQAILRSQSDSRAAQLAVIESQRAGKRSELGVLVDREGSLRRQVALLQQDMAARRPLVDKGLISKLSYLALERELTRLQGDLSETVTQQQRARAALEETGRNSVEVTDRLAAEAMREYGDVSSRLAQTNEELERIEDQVSRLQVRAPVDGVVKGLAAISLRQVVPPGGVIAEVVPSGTTAVAMVRVSPADIGHVKLGSPATVKVATYDFARNGGVNGRIDYVSATSFVDPEGKPFFKARIRLAKDHVGPANSGLILSPGMTVVADIKTGSKTLTEYLFKPVTNAFGSSFNER